MSKRYLQWTLSMLTDACNYNAAKDLTDEQLDAIARVCALCETKCSDMTKVDCEQAHRKLLEVGLALLPNTEKAIAKELAKEPA